MRANKYIPILLILALVFLQVDFCSALAPASSFSDKSVEDIPNSLYSNMDGKNNWYFLSGNENPFTYLRSRLNTNGEAVLEVGTVTNYISLFSFLGVVDFKLQDIENDEKEGKAGASFKALFTGATDKITLDLKYFNDGRALRDLNRMFSGVDPRALKDVIDLFNREENPYKATPDYRITDNQQKLLVSLKPKDHKAEIITAEMKLPKGYVFKKLSPETERTISLKEIESMLGDDKELKKSFETLKANLAKADNGWLALRNLQYNKDKGELKLIRNVVSIERKKTADSSLSVDITFTDNFKKRPKAFKAEDIFNESTLRLTSALAHDKKLKELYTGALSLSKMLVTDSTVLAGVPNYITYFGRDTLYTSMFLFNHFNKETKEHFLSQVIARASKEGECAHEIDTRYSRKDERHYDYRMADSDFIFATSSLKYINLLADDKEALKSFLDTKGKRNRFNNKNGEVMAKNLNYVLQKLITKEALGIKREDDPSSGNWRDALNSLGRGKYPYDLNAVWPKKILYFLEKIDNDPALRNLLLKYSKKAPYLKQVLDNPSQIVNLKNKWSSVNDKFKIELDIKDWQKRLDNFYSQNSDTYSQNLLKEMPAGLGKDGSVITAYDFVYLNKIPVKLPNGEAFPTKFITYSMALDRDFKPTDVVHSDLSIEPLFFDRQFYNEEGLDKKYYEDIFKAYTLPVSLGGLGVYNKAKEYIGFVVANSMLADKDGYNLVLTPSEKANNVSPRSLSPWELLNPDSYHGSGAVWSFQKDFYTIARAKAGLDISEEDFQNLYLQEEQIRPEIFTTHYKGGDFVLKYKSEIEGLSINPCQLWNTAIISVIKNRNKNPLQKKFDSVKLDDVFTSSLSRATVSAAV